MIEFEDFGGQGKTLHFAHANAYSINTYSYFLNLLSSDYQTIGMHQRPMWSDIDPNSFTDWQELAEDLIGFLEQQKLTKIYALGHSMGGIATLLASIKRPDLFEKIILIDPVILPEMVYQAMGMTSIEDRQKMNPMVNIAMNRRNRWASIEEARTYFESKTFYKRFCQEAKNDFLHHGIKKDKEGFTLSYSREWEARIYSTVTNPWEALREINTDTMIIKAEFSDVIRSEKEWRAIEDAAPSAKCIELPNVGHLMPHEKPKALIEVIKEFLG